MNELRPIKLMCEVVLGKRRKALPQNSVQIQRAHQQQESPEEPTSTLTTPLPIPVSAATNKTKELPDLDDNYVSDNKYDDYNRPTPPSQRGYMVRQTKRILQWLQDNTKDGLHRIATLVAHEKAEMPDLWIKNNKTVRVWASVNLDLQMRECVFKKHFTDAIHNKKKGKKFEYRDLIKQPDL